MSCPSGITNLICPQITGCTGLHVTSSKTSSKTNPDLTNKHHRWLCVYDDQARRSQSQVLRSMIWTVLFQISSEENWTFFRHVRNAVHASAVDAMGHTSRKQQDWFDEYDTEIQGLGHAGFMAEQENGGNPVQCREKGHAEVPWWTKDSLWSKEFCTWKNTSDR